MTRRKIQAKGIKPFTLRDMSPLYFLFFTLMRTMQRLNVLILSKLLCESLVIYRKLVYRGHIFQCLYVYLKIISKNMLVHSYSYSPNIMLSYIDQIIKDLFSTKERTCKRPTSFLSNYNKGVVYAQPIIQYLYISIFREFQQLSTLEYKDKRVFYSIGLYRYIYDQYPQSPKSFILY